MNGNLFKFIKESGKRLFFLEQADDLPPGYCIAFLPDRIRPDEALLKNELELAESWEMGEGLYLFLNAAEEALIEEVFVHAVQGLMRDPAFKNTRFIWIDNPLEPPALWMISCLSVSGPTSDTTVSKLGFFNFQNFALHIAKGSRMTLNDTENGFLLTRADDTIDGFLFTTGMGVNRIKGVGDTIEIPFSLKQAGCLQFDLTLGKNLSKEPQDIAKLDISLRLFFQDEVYPRTNQDSFITSQRYPFLNEETGDGWQHFDQSGKALTLFVTLDPLNHLNEARTSFSFADKTGKMASGLPSNYRTNMGHMVHLNPQENSCLVFASRPLSAHPGTGDPYYLVPSGFFEMIVHHVEDDQSDSSEVYDDNLQCGLSGVEYIKLAGEQAHMMRFKPDQNAYAANFIAGRASASAELENAFQPVATTAWSYVHSRNGMDPVYYAQPEQAVLYNEIDTLAEASDNDDLRDDLLEYMEVPSAVLPRANEKPIPNLLPILPYGGLFAPSTSDYHAPAFLFSVESLLQKDLENKALSESWKLAFDQHDISLTNATITPEVPDFRWRISDVDHIYIVQKFSGEFLNVYLQARIAQQLERQLVSPKRRELVNQFNSLVEDPVFLPNKPEDASRTGATPQGLLATFSNDFKTVQEVVLAVDTSNKRLAFDGIGWNDGFKAKALRTALQTAQLFMVISNPDSIKEYFSKNQLEIQRWTFDLDHESWKKHGTVLIFKFNDRPFQEMVDNPSMWSQPGTFNSNIPDIQNKLSTMIQEVLAKDKEDSSPKDRENYGKLAQAFRNRYWSGIIALNVNVPHFPDELKGIAGAIDPEKFYAQYIGIETTPITVRSGKLVPGQSSLFGLIDYRDDTIPIPSPSGYSFQVTNLNVRFQNSEVQAFSCRLSVTLDKLFGELTELQNSPTGRNNIVLTGTAENQDGQMTYAFNYSGDNRFDLPESKVLDMVEILKAQFTTDPGNGSSVKARFSFWGRLNFMRMEGFDILSFGAEDPPEEPNEKHLSFSNLNLMVTFEIDEETGAPKSLDFDFNPRNLAIDLKRSGVRDQSLFAKFPLKFTNFIYSAGEKTIESLGYMPVKSPLSGGIDDSQNWYGLMYNLDLGSLGALSASTGFVVSIIAAWNPSGAGDSNGVHVGLRLPGSTGGKNEIVLQGLLKLTFKSIEFVVDHTDPNKISYLLKLKNIVLKFLLLSMPPSGQTELTIFGNPDGTVNDRTLAWYAAYAKKES